jgi:putrescine---pyruvate transaminase
VIGAGGILHPPEGYWATVQELCRRHDVLLIADEVITGFGRLGCWFGSERLGIEPDLITCAKALTSGYLPLGAVIASERIQEPFWTRPGTLFRHGFTYSGHPSACAAGLANLDLMARERLVERVAEMEQTLTAAVAPLRSAPLVSEIRSGLGLLAAVELHADARAADPGIVDRAVHACRDNGVLTRGLAGRALQISPPYVITQAELERAAAGIAAALETVAASAAAA